MDTILSGIHDLEEKFKQGFNFVEVKVTDSLLEKLFGELNVTVIKENERRELSYLLHLEILSQLGKLKEIFAVPKAKNGQELEHLMEEECIGIFQQFKGTLEDLPSATRARATYFLVFRCLLTKVMKPKRVGNFIKRVIETFVKLNVKLSEIFMLDNNVILSAASMDVPLTCLLCIASGRGCHIGENLALKRGLLLGLCRSLMSWEPTKNPEIEHHSLVVALCNLAPSTNVDVIASSVERILSMLQGAKNLTMQLKSTRDELGKHEELLKKVGGTFNNLLMFLENCTPEEALERMRDVNATAREIDVLCVAEGRIIQTVGIKLSARIAKGKSTDDTPAFKVAAAGGRVPFRNPVTVTEGEAQTYQRRSMTTLQHQAVPETLHPHDLK